MVKGQTMPKRWSCRQFGKDAPRLYWLWNKYSGDAAVAAHLGARFQAKPNEIDTFLESYIGEAWGFESGLPRPSDFTRNLYNEIASLMDPEILSVNLRQRFGKELDAPQWDHSDDTSLDRQIAHQFMLVHQKAREERTQALKRLIDALRTRHSALSRGPD